MSNNGKDEQNGGSPTVNNANVSGKDNVCRDYVWGRCFRERCNRPHKCDLQTMLDILQFCHDYQNTTGCKRFCTFIHATREEEKLFRESGQYPSDLRNRHRKMNMSRYKPYTNQPLPPTTQGPPPNSRPGPFVSSQPGPPPAVQQSTPLLSVNPSYQVPWCLQPPPPPPKEPPPPPQTYPSPTTLNGSPATSYAARIEKTLPQHPKNGSIRRLPNEEGHPSSSNFQNEQTSQIVKIDTTKPPPRLPTRNMFERPLSEPYAGPSKARKIDTESTTCENCLQWDLRNLEIEKKKKDKLKEKGILVLQYEQKKKEIADIVDTLKGLDNDNANRESLDLASMDLRYALSDPDILQRAKPAAEAELARSQSPKPASAPAPPAPPLAPAYSQPPPAAPHFPLAPPYRPPAPHFAQFYPGPSTSTTINNFSVPPPALPPSDQTYYMMGRPPPFT